MVSWILLQSLDVLAADKDVVFLILAGEACRLRSLAIPKPLSSVANNLANSGQKIAVFTVKSWHLGLRPISAAFLS